MSQGITPPAAISTPSLSGDQTWTGLQTFTKSIFAGPVFAGPDPWYDVTHPTYAGGADSTGVADSAPAMQAAANAIPASGGVLFLPPGVFSLSTSVTVSANTVVRGSGRDITIIRARGGYSAGSLFEGSNQDNLSFQSLTLDGNTPWVPPVVTTAASAALPVGDYSVIYAWVGASGDSAQSGRSTQSTAVQTSLTLTTNNQAIAVAALTGLPSYVTSVKFYLLSVPGGVTNGFVQTRTVSGGATAPFTITTQGNGVLPPVGPAGINAPGGSGLRVFDLKTIYTGGSGVIHSNRTRCDILDCHFEQTLQYGIEACSGTATRGSDYQAIGNTFVKCDHPFSAPGGILYCRADDVRIIGNSADTVHGAYILEGCSRITVSGNNANNVRDSGIRISPMDGPAGIDWPYDHYASVTGNTVRGGALSVYHGIVIRGNRCTVTGNEIQGVGANGIDLIIGSPPGVANVNTTGPYFEAHHDTFSGNTILDCQHGIHIDQFGVQIPTVAPTVTAVGGGTLTNGSYTVTYTYTTLEGESAQSPGGGVTVGAGQQINIAQISGIYASVISLNFYYTLSPGTVGFVVTKTPVAGVVAAFTINAQGNGVAAPAVRPYVEDITIVANTISNCSTAGLTFSGDAYGVNTGIFDKWIVADNNLIDNTNPYLAPGAFDILKVRKNCRFRNNLGVPPLSAVTAPSVPASGAPSSALGCDSTVYVTAGSGAITAVAIGGTTVSGLTVAIGATSGALRVPGGQTVTLTFTGTSPSWQWFADNV